MQFAEEKRRAIPSDVTILVLQLLILLPPSPAHHSSIKIFLTNTGLPLAPPAIAWTIALTQREDDLSIARLPHLKPSTPPSPDLSFAAARCILDKFGVGRPPFLQSVEEDHGKGTFLAAAEYVQRILDNVDNPQDLNVPSHPRLLTPLRVTFAILRPSASGTIQIKP